MLHSVRSLKRRKKEMTCRRTDILIDIYPSCGQLKRSEYDGNEKKLYEFCEGFHRSIFGLRKCFDYQIFNVKGCGEFDQICSHPNVLKIKMSHRKISSKYT